MTSGKQFIHPEIQKVTNNLAAILTQQQAVDILASGTPEEKLEAILLACDNLFQPNGNFILVNADVPLKHLFTLK